MDEVERAHGLRIDRNVGGPGKRERPEYHTVLDIFEIKPLGHRLLECGRELLVTKDEVGHFGAQFAGLRNVGETLLRLAAVVFEFQHILEHRKAAFGAGDAETVDEAEAVFQQENDFSSRAMYSATTLATMPCRYSGERSSRMKISRPRNAAAMAEKIAPRRRYRGSWVFGRGGSEQGKTPTSARNPRRCACAKLPRSGAQTRRRRVFSGAGYRRS